jgi:hypothetical protein
LFSDRSKIPELQPGQGADDLPAASLAIDKKSREGAGEFMIKSSLVRLREGGRS